MLTINDFVNLINTKVDDKSPFAFVRYGDGESLILNGNVGEIDFVLHRQLGRVLEKDQILEIKNNLLISYLRADCLGLPTHIHLKREDHWKDSIDILNKTVNTENKQQTSIDACYEMLYNNRFKDILQNRDTVNYISCRNLDKELKETFNIKNINSFLIAPEMKFTSGYEGDNHYPEQFIKIKEWIKTIPCKGNICLVGAGVVGKIYNIWFKDQGGVSLDIGGVFDLWGGRKTRGQGRGIDQTDNTYKL